MKLIARFLKPHLWLCVVTVLLLIVDTAGALFIPTLAAEMLNQGTSGATFDAVLRTGGLMAAASVLSGPGRLRLRHPHRAHRQGHARGAVRQIPQAVQV